jgi:hypothetical protein
MINIPTKFHITNYNALLVVVSYRYHKKVKGNVLTTGSLVIYIVRK